MQIWLIGIVVLVVAVFIVSRNQKRKDQYAFIGTYRFNKIIKTKVAQRYPHLTDENLSLVLDGLKEYFLLCHVANKRIVAMPSQVVDVAWHEFILFTREYQSFCDKAFNRFLHHTPTEAMVTPTRALEGIKRAWRLSCVHHNIDPVNPTRLPLLFEIDSKLNIEDGFKYTLDCQKSHANEYCASHIGCSSGCAGSTADGISDGGGDGGGCGGGGD
ncbi:glycine-rich domain-containing protein [Grimontia sp. NTOU-MAR1]|uniref:glycine-rich domain-containing protein n=1 Tax=Grimontia sp. NTOU-MAR1 TaxID=3111011 RepID=UPI002DBAFF87|nr:hypothetical protein [Grimontia sp. NTOU-MAR1]WRV98691.1 hypothetical protein VP504_04440 [Grimontia sp. NTOU-MAR1]